MAFGQQRGNATSVVGVVVAAALLLVCTVAAFESTVTNEMLDDTSLPALDPYMPPDLNRADLLVLLATQVEDESGETVYENDGVQVSTLLCPSKTAGDIAKVFQKFPSQVKDAAAAAKNLGLEGVRMAGTAGKKALEDLKSAANLPAALKQGAENLKDKVKDAISNGVQGLKGEYNNLKDEVASGFDNAKQGLADGYNNLKNDVASGIDNAKQGLADGYNNLKNDVASGIDNAKQGLADGYNNLKNDVASGIDNAKQGIADGVNNLKNDVASTAAQAKGGLAGLWDKAKQGVSNGLTNLKNKAVDAITDKMGFSTKAPVPAFPKADIPPVDKTTAILAFRAYDTDVGHTGATFQVPGVQGDFKVIGDFGSPGQASFKDKGVTPRGQVIEGPDGTRYVIFRGTSDTQDIVTDVEGVPRDFKDANGNVIGKVHFGAASYYNAIKKQVMDAAFTGLKPGQNVVFGGHSLGGGVATIATGDFVNDPRFKALQPKVRLSTEGAPAFTDATFNKNLDNVEKARYVNTVQETPGGPTYYDPVTQLKTVNVGGLFNGGTGIPYTDARTISTNNLSQENGGNMVKAAIASHTNGYLDYMTGQTRAQINDIKDTTPGDNSQTWTKNTSFYNLQIGQLMSMYVDISPEGSGTSDEICEQEIARAEQFATRFQVAYASRVDTDTEEGIDQLFHLGNLASNASQSVVVSGCYARTDAQYTAMDHMVDQELQKLGELPMPPSSGWTKKELKVMKRVPTFKPMVESLQKSHSALDRAAELAQKNVNKASMEVADQLAQSKAVQEAEALVNGGNSSDPGYRHAEKVMHDVDQAIFREHDIAETAADMLKYRAQVAQYQLHKLAQGVGATELMLQDAIDEDDDLEEGPAMNVADLAEATGTDPDAVALMEEHVQLVKMHADRLWSSRDLLLQASMVVGLGARVTDNVLCNNRSPLQIAEDITKKIAAPIENKVSQVKEAASSIMTAAGAKAQSVAQSIENGASNVVHNVENKVSQVASNLGGQISQAAHNFGGQVQQAASNAVSSVASKAVSAGTSLWNRMKSKVQSAGSSFSAGFKKAGASIVDGAKAIAGSSSQLFSAAAAQTATNTAVDSAAQTTRQDALQQTQRTDDSTQQTATSTASDARSGAQVAKQTAQSGAATTAHDARSEGMDNRQVARDEARSLQSVANSAGSSAADTTRNAATSVEGAIASDGRAQQRGTASTLAQVSGIETTDQKQRLDNQVRREDGKVQSADSGMKSTIEAGEQRSEFARVAASVSSAEAQQKDKLNTDSMKNLENRDSQHLENIDRRDEAKDTAHQDRKSMEKEENKAADVAGSEQRQVDAVSSKERQDETQRRDQDRLKRADNRVKKDTSKAKNEKAALSALTKDVKQGEKRVQRATKRDQAGAKSVVARNAAGDAAVADDKKIGKQLQREEASAAVKRQDARVAKDMKKGEKAVDNSVRRDTKKASTAGQNIAAAQQQAADISKLKDSERSQSEKLRKTARNAATKEDAAVKSDTKEQAQKADMKKMTNRMDRMDARGRASDRSKEEETRKKGREVERKMERADKHSQQQQDRAADNAKRIQDREAAKMQKDTTRSTNKMASAMARNNRNINSATNNTQRQRLADVSKSTASEAKSISQRMDRSSMRNQQKAKRDETRVDQRANRMQSKISSVATSANRNSATPQKRAR